jgi:hypothetical protein
MAERDQAHESLRQWSAVAPVWEASRQHLFVADDVPLRPGPRATPGLLAHRQPMAPNWVRRPARST